MWFYGQGLIIGTNTWGKRKSSTFASYDMCSRKSIYRVSEPRMFITNDNNQLYGLKEKSELHFSCSKYIFRALFKFSDFMNALYEFAKYVIVHKNSWKFRYFINQIVFLKFLAYRTQNDISNAHIQMRFKIFSTLKMEKIWPYTTFTTSTK